jgi:hypothetical protein
MMVTTNTASYRLPSTYVELRDQCEVLLHIADKLVAIALGGGGFSDDAEFQKLKGEFKHHLNVEIMPRISC